jgi:hypothetical protein
MKNVILFVILGLNLFAMGYFENGYELYKKGFYQRAINTFNKGCSLGDSSCCGILGDIYINGKIVKQDVQTGIKYLKKSCKLNNGLACYKLSVNYLTLMNNPQKGFFYAKKSCDLNNARGCMVLAIYYKNGEGIKQDLSKYRKYIHKSCKLGFSNACKIVLSNLDNESDKNYLNISDKINFCKLEKENPSLFKKYINYIKNNLSTFKVKKYAIKFKIDQIFYNLDNIESEIDNSSHNLYPLRVGEVEGIVSTLVQQGYIPFQITLNNINLLSKNGKLSGSYNIKQIAISLVDYLYPINNLEKTIHRLILMDAFWLGKFGVSYFSNCSTFKWESYFVGPIVKLIYDAKEKKSYALKILFLLVNRDFDKLDRYLLQIPEVKVLFNYGVSIVNTEYINELKKYKNVK